jgi:RNA polymerase sigma factor (TIGR02999 family)
MPPDPPPIAASPPDDPELIALVLLRLRTLARRIARGGDVTSQTTSIVHDAWIRLHDTDTPPTPERLPFLAASVVRSVVVDSIRRARQVKRGGRWGRIPLETLDTAPTSNGSSLGKAIRPNAGRDSIDLLELDAALTELQALHECRARVVELRFFGGLNVSQVALALGIGERTVDKDWEIARAWLRDRLDQNR